MRRTVLACVILLLAACQPAGRDPAPAVPSEAAAPAAPAAIRVTPLAPPGAAEVAAVAPPEIAPPAVPPPTAAPPAPVAPAVTAPAPSAEPPEAAPVARSPQQAACERRGGRYIAAGASGARTCVSPTRDAGRRCTRETDCEGRCLARSQTCAPIAPLFGCNEILQADGRRVTLCVD